MVKHNILYVTNIITKARINFDLISFYFGIFLLPSALSISILFLFVSLIISLFKNKKYLLKDNFNKIFLLATIMLITSSIYHFFFNNNLNGNNWDSSLSIIGLANWIPLILIFIGFSNYVETPKRRKLVLLIFLSGTVPVLISGIGQLFFNWHGPLKLLNGLIIWYQRPSEDLFSLTGLFNNPNYAVSWLNIVWPAAIACLIKVDKSFANKFFAIIFAFLIASFIFLTGSRAGFLGMILAIPLLLGSKSLKWFIPFLIFYFTLVISIIFPILGDTTQSFLQRYVPKLLWLNFSSESFENLDMSRLEIWKVAIESIINNPIFGNGANSFSYIFAQNTGIWKSHSHNLPLEIAVSYGIPATLLLLTPIVCLTFKCFRKIYFRNNFLNINLIFEKAWISSLIILITGHLVDIQYFDGRISIAGWILLSGLKNMSYEKNNSEL